jgi:hypothetical protein
MSLEPIHEKTTIQGKAAAPRGGEMAIALRELPGL